MRIKKYELSIKNSSSTLPDSFYSLHDSVFPARDELKEEFRTFLLGITVAAQSPI